MVAHVVGHFSDKLLRDGYDSTIATHDAEDCTVGSDYGFRSVRGMAGAKRSDQA
jgi:hypothetical protein